MIERDIKISEIKETIEFPDYIISKGIKIESYKKLMKNLLKLFIIN